MSDIKLFSLDGENVQELKGSSVKLEKELQILVETHIETLLHAKLVGSEYSTGKTHAGRIDSLGIDENSCPVIIEYKRNTNVNVINQGLFYLDWLMDHQAEFELLVLKKFGKEEAEKIDWSSPRLLCLAEDFTRYDVHAIQQMNRNIELIRYVIYGKKLLLLNLVNSAMSTTNKKNSDDDRAYNSVAKTKEVKCQTADNLLKKATPELRQLYDNLSEYIVDLGSDIQEKRLKWYIAFKKLKNFACVAIQANSLLIWLGVEPRSIELEDGFSRDVSKIGHRGTGNLELNIKNLEDLEKAKPLIKKSYEEN